MPSDIPALYQEKSCFLEDTKQISRNIHMTVLQLYHLPPPPPPPVSSSSRLFTQCQPLYASCCTVLLCISRYCEIKTVFFIFRVCLFFMYYQCEKDYKPIAVQCYIAGCFCWVSVCVSRSAMSNSLQPCGLQPASLLCPWDSLGRTTRVGCHSLLQGIFPTQGLNLGLLHVRQILYHPCQANLVGLMNKLNLTNALLEHNSFVCRELTVDPTLVTQLLNHSIIEYSCTQNLWGSIRFE